MNRICLCLVLSIACVVAIPSQYDARHRHSEPQPHYDVNQSENHELPEEFWTQHFGPEFQHAVHLQLGQTDLIDTTNTITKQQTGSQPKEGNKKRSTYVIHRPRNNERENRTVHGSMQVHLLQPDEIAALEKEMVNFAKENKMAESPVVVNLPVSEGSTKTKDHETPVVLNVPPVVYHHNTPSAAHPHYLGNPRSPLSSYYQTYPSYENSKSSHMKMQPSYLTKPSYEKMQPSIKIASSYEYKNQNSFDDTIMQTPLEQHSRFPYEARSPQTYENMPSVHEDNDQSSYEDPLHQTRQHDESQEVKDAKMDEIA